MEPRNDNLEQQVQVLYLETVERSAMTKLIKCIDEKDFNAADRCIEIMKRLSIV